MKKIVLIIMCILLCGCKEQKEIPESVILNTKDEEILLYSDVYLYDLIKDSNVQIIDKNKLLDTSNIGIKEIELNFKFDNKKYKKNISYNVVDKTPPVFIRATSYYEVVKGEDIYPCNQVVYADNYDRLAKCDTVGDLDLTTIGKYNLKYVLTDSSNNITEKNFVVNVIEERKNKVTSKKKSTKHLYFNEAINKYKNDNNMIGIDISSWQGNIDFNKVKNAGCEFVMIRMAVQSGKDRDIVLDKKFKEYLEGAKNAGLKVGVYVYTTALNKQTALEQAEWIVSELNGIKLDFKIAYDWENWPYFMNYNVNLYELSECVNVFADTLKQYGYDAMLYGSKFYLENMWMNRKNLDVWLAHYTDQTNYKGKYVMWQLSNIGKIDGINGNVDIDIYYK